jgi:aryl-phospho-beta-D-glucosidase BglC (GH1 family)
MPELHWSNGGQWGQTIGQHAMPDLHSVTFWKDFATKYKNHPAVIFDLYNEPHGVSWDIWRDGGEITERLPRGGGERTYQAVGMQTLLDAVRSTGARNVTVIAGLDWSYDLSGILEHGPLHDPLGNGLLYANHAYPFKGDTVDAWIEKLVRASRHLPLIISEFGSETHPQDRVGPQIEARDQAGMILNQAGMTDLDWVEAVLDAIEKNGWHWTAWNLHPAAGPRLISDWEYTATPHFGVPVKRLLLSNESPLGSGNLTRPDR